MTQWTRILGATASTAITLISFSTSAQESTGSEITLGEIVVTAQKRAENLQEIPKQVQVVSDAALENANVTSITDLVKLVPSMTGPNNAMGATSMRGVGTAAPNIGAASKVGVVLDDVPIPSRATSNSNLLDIQQVEVLPGPQGTLAGRNATGGLINLVTRKPSQTALTGSFEASGTDDYEYIAGAYLSAPINDQFAWSLSGNWQERRGMAYNLALSQWDLATRNWGVRGKMLWAPNDDTEITLSWNHSEDRQEGGGSGGYSSIYRQIDVPLNTITSGVECIQVTTQVNAQGNTVCSANPTFGTAAKRTFTQLLPGITPSPDNVNYYSILRAWSERESDLVSLRYEQDFSPGTFTFIGSDLKELFPVSQVWQNYTDVNLNMHPLFDGTAHIINHSYQKTLEARFASKTDQPWTYLVGAFWSDGENRYDYQRYTPTFLANRIFGTQTQALFASTSYTFATDTTVRVGARYEDDTIDYIWDFYNSPATTKTLQNGLVMNFGAYPPGYPDTASEYSDDYVNYDFGVQQKFDNGFMVYANYAYANQGPIFDAESTADSERVNATALPPLPSEEVDSIEVGFKSTWLNDRLTFNLNYFNMQFDNYQALTNVTDTANPNATPQLKTWSAGKVSSTGVELTSSALLGDHTRLDLAGMYNDAYIKDWKNAPCFSNQTVQEGCIMGQKPPGENAVRNYQADISGNQLANAPLVKVTAIGTYSNVLFSTNWDWSGSATIRYQSETIGDQLGNPATKLPATTFVDANLTFTLNKFQFSVFGVNLFEEFAEAFGTGLGAGLSSSLGGASTGRQPDGSYPIKTRTLSRDNVRYFGARVKYSF